MSAVHEKRKDLQCNICKKFFAYNQVLQRHIQFVHEKMKKPFSCDALLHDLITEIFKASVNPSLISLIDCIFLTLINEIIHLPTCRSF